MQVIQRKTWNMPIETTKAFWIAMFQCSIVVIWKKWISSWNMKQRFSTNKSDNCCIQFCSTFRQLHFWQILLKLVFISQCYHESHRGELFLKHSVGSLAYIFVAACRLWVYLHSNLCSGLQKTHLFCTRVRFGSRSFRVIQGRWFWYHQ